MRELPSKRLVLQHSLAQSDVTQGRVAISASLSEVPTAVAYFYRRRNCAELHAMFFELWELGRKIALIEPIHCYGLSDTHIKVLIRRSLWMLNEACHFHVDGFAYSFTLDPSLCPMAPCNSEKLPAHTENSNSLAPATQLFATWSYIWSYKHFHASLLATYFGISDQAAIELLQRLQEAGYLELGKQVGDSLLVKSHTFVLNYQLKMYISEHQFIGITPNTNMFDLIDLDNNNNLATAYHYAWNSMRIFVSFSPSQIAASSGVNELKLQEYINRLYKAGYLQLLAQDEDNPYCDESCYRLVKDSGRIAPITCDDAIYDFNTHSLYKIS